MIKFIHTGDLHLGLRFKNSSFPKDIASNRRVELWHTLERIVDKAIVENMDFLFIAGDLFEDEYFTLGDMKRLKSTLERAKNVEIIITAGNHDNLNKNSLYHMVDWPEHISIFHNKGLDKKFFQDKGVYVYGYSWDKAENHKNIFVNFQGLDLDKNNILIIHGDIFSKDSVYLSLDKNYLNSLGFDYIALGHIHKPEIFSNKMAYCGSPEPLHFGETGKHGIIQGIIENGNTKIEFIPFSKRKFLKETVELNEEMDYIDILNIIRDCAKKGSTEDFYRIELKGILDRHMNLDNLARDQKMIFII